MAHYNPQSDWAVRQLKRAKKTQREMQRYGVIDPNNIMRPYAMRALYGDCAGNGPPATVAIPLSCLAMCISIITITASLSGYGNPTIDSWHIGQGTRHPTLFVNASDNHAVRDVVLNVYDSNNNLVFNKGYSSIYKKEVKIKDELNLNVLAVGTYEARVIAVDNRGHKSDTLEKMIEIPA